MVLDFPQGHIFDFSPTWCSLGPLCYVVQSYSPTSLSPACPSAWDYSSTAAGFFFFPLLHFWTFTEGSDSPFLHCPHPSAWQWIHLVYSPFLLILYHLQICWECSAQGIYAMLNSTGLNVFPGVHHWLLTSTWISCHSSSPCDPENLAGS